MFNKITRIHIASAIKFFFKYWRHKDKNVPNFNTNINEKNLSRTSDKQQKQ